MMDGHPAVVTGADRDLRFTQRNPAAARFIHAFAYAGHLAAPARQLAAAKDPKFEANPYRCERSNEHEPAG
ncbi:hypothetical protein GCM10027290_00740 [Micromonospora sonneratiae]|uniref:Uncharacterized protein n=1 Tax=Micromonospora sonneratiae TaxID=1184706 RepID=A0ABW3Y5R7_9ACTN